MSVLFDSDSSQLVGLFDSDSSQLVGLF